MAKSNKSKGKEAAKAPRSGPSDNDDDLRSQLTREAQTQAAKHRGGKRKPKEDATVNKVGEYIGNGNDKAVMDWEVQVAEKEGASRQRLISHR